MFDVSTTLDLVFFLNPVKLASFVARLLIFYLFLFFNLNDYFIVFLLHGPFHENLQRRDTVVCYDLKPFQIDFILNDALIFQAWAETADDCLTLVSGPGVAEFRIGTKVSFHSSVRTRQSSEYRIVEIVVTP
jgi:hypothetical protein